MAARINTDMLTGDPAKSIIAFAVPLIIANFFQQLYNTADTIIVGRFNGDNALAAVGASFAVTMVMIAFATGTGTGSTVVISRSFGSGDRSKVKTLISTLMISSLILSAVIGVTGFFACRALLELLKTPESIINDAADYLRIYSAGMPFMFLYSVLSSVFSSLGNSRLPLALLLISSAVNIVLDLFFVGTLSMGIKGAAAATLIAQGLCAGISFILVIRNIYCGSGRAYAYKRFSLSALREMAAYGIVSVVQTSATSIGMMLIQAIVNRFGAGALAGYTAASKIDAFAIMPSIACSNALSTFTAQNIGAGKSSRVPEGFKACMGICAFMSAAEFAVISCLKNDFLSLFMDISSSSRDAVDTGIMYMTQMSFCYILMGIYSSQNGLLRGEGMLRTLFLNTILGLAVRVWFAYTAADIIGVCAVWLSMPAGWTFSIIFCAAARAAAKRTGASHQIK